MEIIVPIALIALIVVFFVVFGRKLLAWDATEQNAWRTVEAERTLQRQKS